ncbi:MAG: hypothetical protein Q9177_000248 [Variospora cf. flavescens]
MIRKTVPVFSIALCILTAASVAVARSHSDNGASAMSPVISTTISTHPLASTMASPEALTGSAPISLTYFTHSGYSGLMLAHIGLMTVAWFFVLPISVMLSVARSQYFTLLIGQIIFFSLNAFGLLVSTIYNSKTPDLYGNNLHHKLGWALTWIVFAQAIIGLFRFFSNGRFNAKANGGDQATFMTISAHNRTGYQQMHPGSLASMHRYSHDSGHGTESDSGRSDSLGGLHEGKDEETQHFDHHIQVKQAGAAASSRRFVADRFLFRATQMVPGWLMTATSFFYDAVDVLILIFGFVAILTGFVTYAGVFKGSNIFNGLAHSVKGGVFFWYGILTLGRWMGCFAEYGWAWNVRPPVGMVSARKAKVPSAEFVESFVIFLYGLTNVFLEHLAAWGDTWTAQDLEHVSITIMFFGGGLCGMLVESKKIRQLLNASLARLDAGQKQYGFNEQWTPPKTYSFSMNPFPGLVILLLGLMMSSHHQHSMVSTMVHKQWGTLFVGFALARAVTYILMYLSPPSSYLPSRPPSEIVSSFCLISGGLIFIASNKDTVAAMERYDLNAMFIFTVTMGFTAFLMAWQMIALAIKGWAVRRRQSESVPDRGTLA